MKLHISRLLPVFLIVLYLTGCQTANTTLLIEDNEFKLNDLENKTVTIAPVQIVENNIPEQTKLAVMKIFDNSGTEKLDVDVQSLFAQNIMDGLDLFTVKILNKDFVIENNNGTQVLIPTIRVDDIFKARMNKNIEINSAVTEGTNFILVPLALKLDAESNVNAQFKNADLVDPGIKATISYVIYDVQKKNIALSGVLTGVSEKSGMIDRTLGRNEILLAANNAVNQFVEELRK